MKPISAFLAMSLVFIFASCGYQPASNPVPAGKPVELTPETVSVIRTDLIYETLQSAEAVPRMVQNLSFGVTGPVTQIHVGRLDFVRQGDVLAELDPADHMELIERGEINMHLLDLRKQQRELDARTSEYTLEDAREAYNAARRGGNRDTINRRQLALQRAELTYEMSKLNDILFEKDYVREREAYDLLLESLEKTVMIAPTDGYILYNASLAIGDIAESKTVIFSFVSTADILLHITSRDAVHYQGQDNINVTFEDKSYRAYSYLPAKGDAVWANNIPLTQAFLAFHYAPGNIEAESTVSVRIHIERLNVLAVPRRSIRTYAGETSVDILDGDYIINVPVELGIASGNLVEVISGLSEGDIVFVG